MFRKVERDADGAVVWSSHGNLDIEFGAVHVSPEHSHFIEEISRQGFHVIVRL